MRINADDNLFSYDYELGGHVLGYDKMFRRHGVDARMFQSTDPPRHTAQRKAIAPVVARANAQEIETTIRNLRSNIPDVPPVGQTFNWVEHVSRELTTQVLVTLFDDVTCPLVLESTIALALA